MSRPEIPIDWDLVDELLIAGCLGTEIAARFCMHPTTFYRRVEEKFNMSFTDYSQEKKSLGDSLLRKVQFDKALEKDNTMMVWLGKNRLKQKDTHEVAVEGHTLAEFSSSMNWFKQLQGKGKDAEGSPEDAK
jgi:hypothetical protein